MKPLLSNKNTKDRWDKLSIICQAVSGIGMAIIVLVATCKFNQENLKVNQLNALNKFKSQLTSKNKNEKKFAYEAFVSMGYGKLALDLIENSPDVVGKEVAEKLANSSNEELHNDARKTLEALERIWVLEDADPDYRNPPFGDVISILGNTGEVQKKIYNLNIAGTVGNYRPFAISPEGKSVYVAENVNGKLSKFDLFGDIIWVKKYSRSKNIKMYSVAVSSDGSLYVLSSPGTISGHSILRMDPSNGEILNESNIGGFDLAVDGKNSTIWVVGQDVKKTNLSLNLECNYSEIGYVAVSVDYDSEGSAWFAERTHPDINNSKNRLHKIDSNCSGLKIIDLDVSPSEIRVARNDKDSLWAIIGGQLYKYDKNGNLLFKITTGTRGITVNHRDNSVWAVGGAGEIFHYSANGELLLRRKEFSSGGGQKYIAIS